MSFNNSYREEPGWEGLLGWPGRLLRVQPSAGSCGLLGRAIRSARGSSQAHSWGEVWWNTS